MKMLCIVVLGFSLLLPGHSPARDISYSTSSTPPELPEQGEGFRAEEDAVVPGRILVKFTPATASYYRRYGRLPWRVAGMNRTYGVKEIRPLFPGMVKRMKSQRMSFQKHVEEIKKKFPVRAARARSGAQIPDISLWYRLEMDEGVDIGAAAKEYGDLSEVDLACPVSYAQLNSDPLPEVPYIPDDEFIEDAANPGHFREGSWGQDYPDLWRLQKIQAIEAWNAFDKNNNGLFDGGETPPGGGIVVAVVDSGVDYGHEDLKQNIWQNPGEDLDGDGVLQWDAIGQTWVLDPDDLDGEDSDGNGFADDLVGWNVQPDIENGEKEYDPRDGYGHGTHCAGVIAAVANNGIGIAGVAPFSKIMAVNGAGSDKGLDSFVEGLQYAVDNGADVVNNSWGHHSPYPIDPPVEEVVRYAYGLGVILVFAAGNNGDDVAYYSPNNMDEVLTVAATTPDDVKWYTSCWGDRVDVSAPGGGYPDEPIAPPPDYNILSTMSGDCEFALNADQIKVSEGYYRTAGTSMACPHVAGLAALILSAHPDWSNAAVICHIKNTADEIDGFNPGYEGKLGTGRINALTALGSPPPAPQVAVEHVEVDDSSGNGDGLADPGEMIVLKVSLRNSGEAVQNVSTALNTNDPYVEMMDNQQILDGIGYGELATSEFTFAVRNNFPADHDLPFQLNLICGGDPGNEAIVVPGYWKDIYVSCENLTPPWLGTEDDPYRFIQDGVDAALPFTNIHVARGTYFENIVVSGLQSLCIFGGYEPDYWSRDVELNETTINGGGDRAVAFERASSSSLSGFTILNGGEIWGGGIYCFWSSIVISDNTIKDNFAAKGGGGVLCSFTSGEITGNDITGNQSETDGAGIYLKHSFFEITNNFITRNEAAGKGGGIYLLYSSPAIINNTVADNAAGSFSMAGQEGGGLYCESSSPLILNSIFWMNTAQGLPQFYCDPGSSPEVTSCNIQGGWSSGDNLDAYPVFVDAGSGDYHLQYFSPCIDTGIFQEYVPGIDIDGDPRPIDIPGKGEDGTGKEFDIGADEYSGSVIKLQFPSHDILMPRQPKFLPDPNDPFNPFPWPTPTPCPPPRGR
ncbi:MAG: S8 family serine peptidase [PVC group bacterium]